MHRSIKKKIGVILCLKKTVGRNNSPVDSESAVSVDPDWSFHCCGMEKSPLSIHHTPPSPSSPPPPLQHNVHTHNMYTPHTLDLSTITKDCVILSVPCSYAEMDKHVHNCIRHTCFQGSTLSNGNLYIA